jgi:transcription elongation GreA/GreB family factor
VTPAPQALREIAHPTGTANAPSPDAIRIGDRVVIQYLDDRKQLTVTLTKDRDDITNGYLPVTSPLGSQLLGASEDEEVEFNIGDRVRRVLILRADRPVQA